MGGGLTFPSVGFDASDLVSFEQDPFFDGDAYSANMGQVGFVFVPKRCREGASSSSSPCRLHVHFHGCGMHFDAVGLDFILGSGFLDVAEQNDIVMLFPQVATKYYYVQGGHQMSHHRLVALLGDLHGLRLRVGLLQLVRLSRRSGGQ